MKKIVLCLGCSLLFVACNMNPNKEERIQKLETELQNSSDKINALEKKIELNQTNDTSTMKSKMPLGAFSVSLSVKNLEVSKEFYENLGFVQLGGDEAKNYLIMKNENAIIGLFQGMFDGNILTFNPGWNENGEETKSFIDIRKIQQVINNKGIEAGAEIAKDTSGPASFMITDPDGNVILFDQHR